MDLHSRRDLIDSMSERYGRASRVSKTRILNEVCAATGFHRKYAITRINLVETSRPATRPLPRQREKTYGRDVLAVIEKVWEEAGYPWSVRLKAILHLKLIGWDRYDTPESVAALNDLYANELRLYMNLFQPSVKLIRTVRKGSRKVRRYDDPRTPLDRLAGMPGADPQKVDALLHLRSRLDPFDLSRIIRRKLEQI